MKKQTNDFQANVETKEAAEKANISWMYPDYGNYSLVWITYVQKRKECMPPDSYSRYCVPWAALTLTSRVPIGKLKDRVGYRILVRRGDVASY